MRIWRNLVYALVLETSVFGHAGSTPVIRTTHPTMRVGVSPQFVFFVGEGSVEEALGFPPHRGIKKGVWLSGSRQGTLNPKIVGSNPTTLIRMHGRMVMQAALNRRDVGSIPTASIESPHAGIR